MGPRGGMRVAALATVLTFGCATVHEPLPPPAAAPPMGRMGVTEPEVTLWVEGVSSVDPAEADRALAEARAALAAALQGRGAAPAEGEADAILQVRERAVVRTGGRKTNQALTIAAMVIGFVVAVAVIVLAVVSGSKSSGGTSAPTARSGGRATAPAPAHSSGVAGAATAPPRAGGGGTVPAPPARPPSGTAPAPPPGAVGPGPLPPPPPPAGVSASVGIDLPIPFPDDAAPPEATPAYVPPPPPTFDPKERGFFDGDETLIDLELEDARTGEVVWSTSVRDGIDPRDRGEVSRLLDQVLRGQPWARPPSTGSHPVAPSP